jgi:hypothetical protein
VAAAAALLAGTFFGPYLGLALDFRSVNTEASPLKEAMAKSDTVIKRDGSLKSAFDAKEKATKDEETAVRSIIAGLDERLNWIRLIQFLSDALPRPDGYNLSKAAWDEFYIKKGGQDALGRLQRRLGMAKSDASSALADIDPALIQFNIEALDARYTEDLAAVWTRLKEDPYRIPKEDVRPVGQYDNPPKEKEKGWVVELRGFTYNNGGRRFVLEGLVDALATRGIKQAPAPTTPSGSDPKATPAPPPTGSPESSTASTSSDTKEPVLDRISHVVLLKVTEPDNGGEELTKNGKVDTLVTTSFRSLLGSGGGMPGMGSFAGGPMVGQSSASRSGGGPKFSAMTPGAPSSGSGSSPSRSPITTPTPGSMGSGGPATMQGGSSRGGRTDFIVLFFWREPAPSDQYLPPRPEEPQGGQMGPGGPMGPMGPMGPPSGIMGGSSTMPGGK